MLRDVATAFVLIKFKQSLLMDVVSCSMKSGGLSPVSLSGLDLKPFHVWIFSEQIGIWTCFLVIFRFLAVSIDPPMLRIYFSVTDVG
jgi:hypothetical protein